MLEKCQVPAHNTPYPLSLILDSFRCTEHRVMSIQYRASSAWGSRNQNREVHYFFAPATLVWWARSHGGLPLWVVCCTEIFRWIGVTEGFCVLDWMCMVRKCRFCSKKVLIRSSLLWFGSGGMSDQGYIYPVDTEHNFKLRSFLEGISYTRTLI